MGENMRRFINAKRHTGFKQGLINALALPSFFARLQGGHDRQRRKHPRRDIGNGDWKAIGFAIRRAIAGHKARHALRHHIQATMIRPRPRLAKA